MSKTNFFCTGYLNRRWKYLVLIKKKGSLKIRQMDICFSNKTAMFQNKSSELGGI